MQPHLNNCTFNYCKFFKVDFIYASLIKSTFKECTLECLDIYGANIWDIDIDENTTQKDIRIPYRQFKGKDSEILSIDDIQVGNIIYLLLDNSNYTRLLNQSKKKSVLLLGRFGDPLKEHLNELTKEVRNNGFSPIVFDFQAPNTLDLIEAIVLLSLLSKFIIVDLTEARSVPAELHAILSTLTIPVVPIIKRHSEVFSTYTFTNKYSCVLPILIFDDIKDLSGSIFAKEIIEPADNLYNKISGIKQGKATFRDVKKNKSRK